MTVSELVEQLKAMPQDARVYYGVDESFREPDGLPVFGLYRFTPVHYPKVRSCRSSLPTSNQVEENVVVFEYD